MPEAVPNNFAYLQIAHPRNCGKFPQYVVFFSHIQAQGLTGDPFLIYVFSGPRVTQPGSISVCLLHESLYLNFLPSIKAFNQKKAIDSCFMGITKLSTSSLESPNFV